MSSKSISFLSIDNEHKNDLCFDIQIDQETIAYTPKIDKDLSPESKPQELNFNFLENLDIQEFETPFKYEESSFSIQEELDIPQWSHKPQINLLEEDSLFLALSKNKDKELVDSSKKRI